MPNEPSWQFNELVNQVSDSRISRPEEYNEFFIDRSNLRQSCDIRSPFTLDYEYDWTEWETLTTKTDVVIVEWLWWRIFQYICNNCCWNKLRTNLELPWLYICKKCTDEKTRVCKN
jgi:hypothetical protein